MSTDKEKEMDLKEINQKLKEVNKMIRKTKLDEILLDELEGEDIEIKEDIIEENSNEITSETEVLLEEYEGNDDFGDFESEEEYEEYKDCIDDSDFDEGSDDDPEEDDFEEDESLKEKAREFKEIKENKNNGVNFKVISKEEYTNLKEHESVFVQYKNNKAKKAILTSIVAIFLLFIGFFIYKDNFISNDKYAFKFGDVKIERSIVEKLKSNFSSEEEIAYFIMDTLNYSKMAKEDRITVTEEEIEKYSKDFTVYKEEIALSHKILEVYAEKTSQLKEEDLKKLYEENKELYVKSGDVKFIALDSENYIPVDYKLTEEEISKFEVNEEKIENLIGSGIYPTEIVIEKPLLFEYDSDENGELIYRYFYILEKNVTDYYSFEDSIDYIKSEYDKTNGYASLIYKNQAIQENLTIEYYN